MKRLSLNSNPMLMSINSQAFVGTPALQAIEVESCQSLEEAARQLLENVTMMATSRQLLQKVTVNSDPSNQLIQASAGDKLPKEPMDLGAAVGSKLQRNLGLPVLSGALSTVGVNGSFVSSLDALPANQPSAISDNIKHILELQSSRLKYVYYGATLCLLALVLKLVFKYTSTNYYMESRRRRRRVYEATSSSPSFTCSQNLDAQSSPNCSELDSDYSFSMSARVEYFQMCVQRPNDIVIGAAATRRQQEILVHQEQVSSPMGSDLIPSPVVGDYTTKPSPYGGADYELSATNEIDQMSVIAGVQHMTRSVSPTLTDTCCSECPAVDLSDCCSQATASVQLREADDLQDAQVQHQDVATDQINHIQLTMQQPSPQSHLDLRHPQTLATGYDLDHADCDHFYRSLGPALQMADDMATDYSMDGYC